MRESILLLLYWPTATVSCCQTVCFPLPTGSLRPSLVHCYQMLYGSLASYKCLHASGFYWLAWVSNRGWEKSKQKNCCNFAHLRKQQMGQGWNKISKDQSKANIWLLLGFIPVRQDKQWLSWHKVILSLIMCKGLYGWAGRRGVFPDIW